MRRKPEYFALQGGLDNATPPLEMPAGCTFHPRCASAMPQCSQVAPKPIAQPDGHVECHLFDETSGKLAS